MQQLKDGLDPKQEKQKARDARLKAKAARQKRKTFLDCAEAVFKARSSGWRRSAEGRESSASDWIRSLNKDCAPLRRLAVEDIGLDDVKKVVQPFWDNSKTSTARRLLNRIELVMSYAIAHGYRHGDNPASWTIFQHLAPAQPKNSKAPHAALDWREAPALMARLREIDSTAARCLEFLILTATRSGEARGANWSEIAFAIATWSIPPERMKAAEPHEVPLSRRALALLDRLESPRNTGLIFPSPLKGKIIDAAVLSRLLHEVAPKVTVHGMRATFKTFCGDHGVPRGLAELSLAHRIGNAVEQAYDRTALLERRRPAMQAWADFLSGEAETGRVVPINRGKRK
jgi:integrase